MKKLFSATCLAILSVAALSSCCGKGECGDSCCAEDTTVAKALLDSISIAQGTYIGDAVLSNFPQMAKSSDINKEDMIKGIQLVLGAKDNKSTQIGMQFGLQMINEMKQLEELGINVDRHLMLQYFKKAFLQDSIDQEDAQHAYGVYQRLVNDVQAQIKAREEARIAASPEAVKNVQEGDDFLAVVLSADPEVKTTDSGLSYKIIAVGEGNPVADAKRLKVKYIERKVNGDVVVETPETGRLTYLSNVTPGFAEGLKMLSNGGKAIFYVPGAIAYGVNGIPSRNVGPNEMMIYDVEVIDVE